MNICISTPPTSFNGQEGLHYVVMDNFYKMILGFHVEEAICFNLIKGALQNAPLLTISTYPDQSECFLVADGGRENHNQRLDEFIASLMDFKMTKIKAKDIQFSNSPIEAIHRILKGRYLQKQKFKSIETPKEVYFNVPLKFDAGQRMKKAITARIIKNKTSSCSACTTWQVSTPLSAAQPLLKCSALPPTKSI
jgi:hypothetical protein